MWFTILQTTKEKIRTVLNESLMSLLQVNKKRSNDDEEKEKKRGTTVTQTKTHASKCSARAWVRACSPVAGDLLEVAFIPNGETDNYNTW